MAAEECVTEVNSTDKFNVNTLVFKALRAASSISKSKLPAYTTYDLLLVATV